MRVGLPFLYTALGLDLTEPLWGPRIASWLWPPQLFDYAGIVSPAGLPVDAVWTLVTIGRGAPTVVNFNPVPAGRRAPARVIGAVGLVAAQGWETSAGLLEQSDRPGVVRPVMNLVAGSRILVAAGTRIDLPGITSGPLVSDGQWIPVSRGGQFVMPPLGDPRSSDGARDRLPLKPYSGAYRSTAVASFESSLAPRSGRSITLMVEQEDGVVVSRVHVEPPGPRIDPNLAVAGIRRGRAGDLDLPLWVGGCTLKTPTVTLRPTDAFRRPGGNRRPSPRNSVLAADRGHPASASRVTRPADRSPGTRRLARCGAHLASRRERRGARPPRTLGPSRRRGCCGGCRSTPSDDAAPAGADSLMAGPRLGANTGWPDRPWRIAPGYHLMARALHADRRAGGRIARSRDLRYTRALDGSARPSS